ncbi:MAG: hypothetical protein M3447_13455 [Acidobacteriota bacterium]|nr:hypothetical protein [Acidobacteriota bacterium]
MKLARSIIGVALALLGISALKNTASQQGVVTQRPTGATRVYVPPLRISNERPISFEEWPRSGQVNEQYEEALGIIFNDADVSIYPEGFAHSGTRAIARCAGENFGCDTQFVMKFSKKPQRRVKVSFGYAERVAQADEVVLKVFNAAGTPIGEASAALAVSDEQVRVTRDLEIAAETNEITSATVSFRKNVNNFASLVLDDIDFDDLLPQPDLTIETVQAELGLDRQLTVTAAVRNIGKGSSTPTILQLSEPRFWQTPPGIALTALKPGESMSVTLVTLLPADQPRRAYSYIAVVDPQQTITDSDPTNNFKTDRFVLARGKPDLTVRIVDAGVDADQHAFVIAEITNIGPAASTPTVVKVETGGQTIGTATVDTLQPNGSVQVNVRIPEKLAAGRHTIQAVVNPDKSLDEADLTNNSITGLLAIPVIWWRQPEYLLPIGIFVLAVGMLMAYKLVKRTLRHEPEPLTKQAASQPHPTLPNFVARPKVDHGRQELTLISPETPAAALQLRSQIGASATQIFDGITASHRGEP